MLNIKLPSQLELKVKKYSIEKQIDINQLFTFMVKKYMEGEIFLKELERWDKLSDEAWINFEKDYL